VTTKTEALEFLSKLLDDPGVLASIDLYRRQVEKAFDAAADQALSNAIRICEMVAKKTAKNPDKAAGAQTCADLIRDLQRKCRSD